MSRSSAMPKSRDAVVLGNVGVSVPGWESTRISGKVEPGKLLLVVGPLGAGKTLLAEALAGVKRPGVALSGTAELGGEPLVRHHVALAPEDARLSALATDLVGPTLLHAAQRSGARTRAAAHSAAARQLHAVDLRDASRCYHLQFRELSGGERRRATLALSLVQKPELLITDGLFGDMDDPGRAAARRALAAYLAQGGRVLAFERSRRHLEELASAWCVLERTPLEEPSTASASTVGSATPAPTTGGPLLELSRLGAARGRRGWFYKGRKALAIDGASLDVRRGEIVALVGENASGKTSLLEVTAGLVPSSFGQVVLSGEDLTQASERRLRRLRRRMQLVFQEASTALAPHKSVRELLEEAQALSPRDARKRNETPATWLERVDMPPSLLERYADELSSGEAQRVELARRLAVRPEIALLDAPHVAGLGDEPANTSGAAVAPLEALLRHERSLGTSFLIAEPALGSLRSLADRVAVLLAGRVIEFGPTSAVRGAPLHPYARQLFDDGAVESPSSEAPSSPKSRPPGALPSATTRARRQLSVLLEGARTEPRRPSRGCPFVTRCPRAVSGLCDKEEPLLAETVPGSGHKVACYRPHQ